MKSCIIIALLFVSSFVVGQSSAAKIKFEQAETSYDSGNYNEALTYLVETEKLLKTSNTRIQYLRILTLDKKLKSDTTITYEELVSLRQNCTTYLKTVDGKPEYEDKFKEVYFISDDLKKYPNTKVDFQTHLTSLKKVKKEEQDKKNELIKLELLKEKVKSYKSSLDGVAIGHTDSQIPSSAWSYVARPGYIYEKGNTIYPERTFIIYIPPYKSLKIKSSLGLSGISIDQDTKKVFAISKVLRVGGKSSQVSILTEFEQNVEKMKTYFGSENIEVTESTYDKDAVHTLTKVATIKGKLKYNYSIVYNFMDYGPGTECTIRESLAEEL